MTQPQSLPKPLDNPQHEALAQALARGLSLREAHQAAGYTQYRPSRMKRRAEKGGVYARVAELRSEAFWRGDAPRRKIYEEAMAAAKAATETKTGAGYEAARGLFAEAARAVREAAQAADDAAEGLAGSPVPAPPELTKDEWIALFAAPGP